MTNAPTGEGVGSLASAVQDSTGLHGRTDSPDGVASPDRGQRAATGREPGPGALGERSATATTGSIFDIKRFAVHDGPGIRTTVFFKGCALSCLGCHNPEGQTVGPELFFRPDRCTRCGDCLPVCPEGALSLTEQGVEVARDRCRLTGACVKACLPGALEILGDRMEVGAVLDLLERDRLYYDESGGGVTFSGGEPFSQPEFLREMLLECRRRDLSVTLDTCGHVHPDTFRELAPLASHLLYDLKLMDPDRHEAFTGVRNHWILENLRWAAAYRVSNGSREAFEVTVRIPLIPGVNADDENLEATAVFLAGLAGPPPVDLLPYHLLGVDKYVRLGREYGLPETSPPTPREVGRAVQIFRAAGLTVTVRGEPYDDD